MDKQIAGSPSTSTGRALKYTTGLAQGQDNISKFQKMSLWDIILRQKKCLDDQKVIIFFWIRFVFITQNNELLVAHNRAISVCRDIKVEFCVLVGTQSNKVAQVRLHGGNTYIFWYISTNS